jgi:hypothetical protein
VTPEAILIDLIGGKARLEEGFGVGGNGQGQRVGGAQAHQGITCGQGAHRAGIRRGIGRAQQPDGHPLVELDAFHNVIHRVVGRSQQRRQFHRACRERRQLGNIF